MKRDRSLTENKIIKASYDLFASKGFKATTMRMISEKSGCNITLISRYFGSKKKLFEKIIEDEFKSFTEYHIDYSSAESYADVLRYFLRESIQIFINNENFFRLITRESISEYNYGKYMEIIHKGGEERLASVLYEISQKLSFSDDINFNSISHLAFVFLSGILIRYMMYGKNEYNRLDDEIVMFIDIILKKPDQ